MNRRQFLSFGLLVPTLPDAFSWKLLRRRRSGLYIFKDHWMPDKHEFHNHVVSKITSLVKHNDTQVTFTAAPHELYPILI